MRIMLFLPLSVVGESVQKEQINELLLEPWGRTVHQESCFSFAVTGGFEPFFLRYIKREVLWAVIWLVP